MRGCGRGKQATAPHDHVRDAIARGHADDRADGFAIEEPAVTADHQRRTSRDGGLVEQRLHEVLEIVRLLKHGCALP